LKPLAIFYIEQNFNPLKQAVLYLTFLTLLFGCRPDVNTPSWEVEALAPLVNTRIDFNDLIDEDTSLVAGSEGLVSLVYRNKLLSFKPGEIAPPFNNTFFNTVKISSIDLGTRQVNERISLGQIAKQAGVIGQIIIASNGSSQAIPPVNGLGPNYFNVDATDYFQSMTLQDGWLILRLENGLPIELRNVEYAIGNAGGAPPLLQNTLSVFPPGAVQIDSVHLINNITINGQLEASLLNVDIPGTNGAQVPIDTSDALLVQLTIDKLDPVSATAIFPAQNLYADTATANIFPSTAKLTAVHIASGEIYLDATSTVDDIISLEYLIPGARRNGQSLGFVEQVPAAPPGGFSAKYSEVPVNNHTIDLTGLPGSVDVFNEFYTVFFARVDSSGRLINLSLDDSVYIKTGINNLVADRGYGFMGYDTSITNTSSPVTGLEVLQNGSFSFEDVRLEVEVENYVGAPAAIKVFGVDGQSNGASNSLNWDDYGKELTIPRATEQVPGQKPIPGRAVFSVNKGNSNVSSFFTNIWDTLNLTAETYLNPYVPNTDLSQFLYTDYGFEAYLNMHIPLHMSVSNLVAQDTSEFNYQELDPNDQLIGGKLRLLANNMYPFIIKLDVVLLDENKQALGTLQSGDVIASAQTDADGRASALTKSKIDYPLTTTSVDLLRQCSYMVFVATFNTPNAPDRIKVYSDNYLDLTLVGDVSVSTK
jgi:hypothetical protein